MNAEYILKADLIDIIFAGRNKSYGAYSLRKFYRERLFKAIGILFCVVILLSAFTLFQKRSIVISDEENVREIYIPHTAPEKPTPPQNTRPKQKAANGGKSKGQSESRLIIVKNTDSSKKINGPVNIPETVDLGDSSNSEIKRPVSDSFQGTAGKFVNKIKADLNIPLLTAEVMPSFPGGIEALRKFLQKNLRNPRGLETEELISVKVRCIVGFDGLLKGFEIIEDGGADFNNEVIRVLKKMPEWIPGKSAGENVSVYYVIPVKFISTE